MGAALTFNLQQCNKQITNFLNSIDAQFTRHHYPELLFQSGSVIAVTPGRKKKKKNINEKHILKVKNRKREGEPHGFNEKYYKTKVTEGNLKI